jgi:hypothetical protein
VDFLERCILDGMRVVRLALVGNAAAGALFAYRDNLLTSAAALASPRRSDCVPASLSCQPVATLRRSNGMVAQALQTSTTAVEQQHALFDAWEGNV